MVAVAVLLPCVAAGGAEAEPGVSWLARIAPGGSLDWVFGDDVEILGSMRVEIPFLERDRAAGYASLDARTVIDGASEGLTFDVREIGYAVEAGARVGLGGGGTCFVAAGQRGKEAVDAAGSAFVRWIGAGYESARFRSRDRSGLAWSGSAAAVVDRHDVEADARLLGEVRWMRPAGRVFLGAGAAAESVLEGGRLLTDLTVGPRLDVPVADGRLVSLRVRWIRERSPFGAGITGIAAGFDLSELPWESLRRSPPDVGGTVELGGWSDRAARELAVRVLSPPFASRYSAVLDVDGNVVTGAGSDELYYVYQLGIERDGPTRIGVFATHRSNHLLGAVNEGVTSLNVLEVGVESAGYLGRGPSVPAGPVGAFDYRLRAGGVLDATIEGSERWQAGAGIRLSLPHGASSVVPVARAEIEAGRGDRRSLSAGVSLPPGIELRVERRRDDQYYGPAKVATLLLAAATF